MKNNPLLSNLKSIADPADIVNQLNQESLQRDDALKLPPHERASTCVDKINQIFITNPVHIKAAYMINDMLHQNYSNCNPSSPDHIMSYYSNNIVKPSIAAIIQGYPGVGKTWAISRILSSYKQIVSHNEFPHFTGTYNQVMWFSISVKADTRLGFYRDLANSWNALCKRYSPDESQPISNEIIIKGSGDLIFDKFLSSAKNHNIGLIHLDEIQNLFDLTNLNVKTRISYVSDTSSMRLKISPKDSILLGKILGLLNTGIPTLISCTPDGTKGLEQKGSVIQRVGSNFIQMNHMKKDESSYRRFVSKLFEYQYTDDLTIPDDELFDKLHSLTAGVPRLITKLFQDSQKLALRSGKSKIDLNDMTQIVQQYSPALKSLIYAIQKDDKNHLNSLTDYQRY